MLNYLNLLQHIKDNGTLKTTRNGQTLSIFGYQLRFDLSKGFPLVTTKKIHLKSVIHELLWFLKGDTNVKYLQDNNVRIWNEWADENGNLGKIYGYQWRSYDIYKNLNASNTLELGKNMWNLAKDYDYFKDCQFSQYPRAEKIENIKKMSSLDVISDFDLELIHKPLQSSRDEDVVNYVKPSNSVLVNHFKLDQIAEVIKEIKTNPNSRRLIVNSWNPAQLDEMALPPCHCFFQFYVSNGKLSLQLYQRSCDVFLGLPFNIASYSLLLHLIALECNLEVGEFIWTGGDIHIYTDHLDQVNIQLSREPLELPKLEINYKPNLEYQFEDIKVINYKSYPKITAKVNV